MLGDTGTLVAGTSDVLQASDTAGGIASALTAAVEEEARSCGFDRIRLTVGVDNAAAQALYRSLRYVDAGVPPKRVRGTIMLRTGPLEVDDTLLTWEKLLSPT